MTEDLVARWVAGDPAAGDELYLRYRDRVRGFARRLGSGDDDADDIAQEAMIAGLEGLRGGKRPDRLTQWLMGIARHLAARRRGRRRAAELRDEELDPRGRGAATLAARREMKELLDRSLHDLPPLYREVLELHHRKNLSRREIAARLGVSMEVVHARCERAYARLREGLSRHFTTMVLSPLEPVTLERIRALRPAFREAVIAVRLEGLSESVAASRLGIPVATLRARLESAYELLKCTRDADFGEARRAYRR